MAEVHSLSPPMKTQKDHTESQEDPITQTPPKITVTPDEHVTPPDKEGELATPPPVIDDKQGPVVTEEDVRHSVLRRGSEERSESVSRKETDSIDGIRKVSWKGGE